MTYWYVSIDWDGCWFIWDIWPIANVTFWTDGNASRDSSHSSCNNANELSMMNQFTWGKNKFSTRNRTSFSIRRVSPNIKFSLTDKPCPSIRIQSAGYFLSMSICQRSQSHNEIIINLLIRINQSQLVKFIHTVFVQFVDSDFDHGWKWSSKWFENVWDLLTHKDWDITTSSHTSCSSATDAQTN